MLIKVPVTELEPQPGNVVRDTVLFIEIMLNTVMCLSPCQVMSSLLLRDTRYQISIQAYKEWSQWPQE